MAEQDPAGIIGSCTDLVSVVMGGMSPNIPDGFAPGAIFTVPEIPEGEGLGPEVPPYDPINLNPSQTQSGTPIPATWSPSRPNIGFTRLTALTDPTYGTATAPPTLPTPDLEPPPVDYPTSDPLALPDEPTFLGDSVPDITIGTRAELDEIELEDFVPTFLEPLVYELPEFEEIDAELLEPPEELTYDADAPLLAHMTQALESGNLLPEDAQLRILNDLLRELTRQEYAAENQVFEEAAAAGFSLPTGAMEAQLLTRAYEALRKRDELNHKVMGEAYSKAMESMSTAVQKGLSLEEKHFALLTTYAEMLVKTQTFNVRIASVALNQAIDLYNTQVSIIDTLVQNYKQYLAAVAEQNSTMQSKAQMIEAKADTETVEVAQYSAQMDTARAIASGQSLSAKWATLPIQEYNAYIKGVKANLQVTRLNVDAFKAAIEVFAQGTQRDLASIRAASEGVSAWGSQLAVDNANLQAFSQFYDHAGVRASSYAEQMRVYNSALGAQLQDYSRYLTTQRGYFSAMQEKLSSKLAMTVEYGSTMREILDYTNTWNEATEAKAKETNAINLANADRVARQSALTAENVSTQASIEAGRLAARANTAAGIAQAAYGLTGGSLRMTGRVESSAGTTDSSGQSWRTSATRSWSKNTTYVGDQG